MKEPGPPCCGNIVLTGAVRTGTVLTGAVRTGTVLIDAVRTDNGPDGCDR